MIVNLSFKIDERNSGNIFIGVEREWREKEKREQVGKKITMVELSRIFHERSRGRGNGAANENGSRQGKLIRSGAMTREKLPSEIDERLSLSLHRYPRHTLFLSLSLTSMRFPSIRYFSQSPKYSPLASKEAKDIKEISNLSDQRVICASRGIRVCFVLLVQQFFVQV